VSAHSAAAILFFSLPSPAKDWWNIPDAADSGAYHDGDSFSQVTGLKVGGEAGLEDKLAALWSGLCGDRRPGARTAARAGEGVQRSGIRSQGLGQEGHGILGKISLRAVPCNDASRGRRGCEREESLLSIIIGADGRLLHEALLEAGLARAYECPLPGRQSRRLSASSRS